MYNYVKKIFFALDLGKLFVSLQDFVCASRGVILEYVFGMENKYSTKTRGQHGAKIMTR